MTFIVLVIIESIIMLLIITKIDKLIFILFHAELRGLSGAGLSQLLQALYMD